MNNLVSINYSSIYLNVFPVPCQFTKPLFKKYNDRAYVQHYVIFDRIFYLQKVLSLIPWKSIHHSHYAQFELINLIFKILILIFSYVVAQKRFLVRLEIYWQKVDMTDSSHQFIQQTELYQCHCIAKLNWNSSQNPKYQWKYYISRALQLQPCHNALKYWK